jgi:hypothetical protein
MNTLSLNVLNALNAWPSKYSPPQRMGKNTLTLNLGDTAAQCA